MWTVDIIYYDGVLEIQFFIVCRPKDGEQSAPKAKTLANIKYITSAIYNWISFVFLTLTSWYRNINHVNTYTKTTG